MAASDHLNPAQFVIPHRELAGLYSTVTGLHLPELADRHYSIAPHYMAALEDDIRRNGIQHPAELDEHGLQEGNHRASVALRLGMDLPATHYQRDAPYAEGYRQHTEEWHDKYYGMLSEGRL